MIVVDASVVVELLLAAAGAEQATALVTDRDEELAVPHLLDAEVAHVLRRYERAGRIGAHRLWTAVEDLGDLPLVRYPHLPFVPRALELRDNATAYDALYLALAEALGASLVTADAALQAVPGARVEVRRLGVD